jgi:hypothetical protein
MPEVLASKLTEEHAQALLALEGKLLKRVREIHEAARFELRGRLADVAAEIFTAQHYRVTLAQIERALAELERRLSNEGGRELLAALEQGVEQTLAEIAFWEAARGFRVAESGRIQLDALQRVSREMLLERFETSVRRFGLELLGDVQRRLGLHLAKRSAWPDMATDIAGRLRVGSSVVQGAAWKAERIVRTELVHALNAGHQAALEASEPRLPGLARQWDAHLDARTSDVCKSLHGQVRGIEEPWSYEGREIMHPPAIPNCRARVLPWREAWAELEKESAA